MRLSEARCVVMCGGRAVLFAGAMGLALSAMAQTADTTLSPRGDKDGAPAVAGAYVPTMTFDVASVREVQPTDPMMVGGGFHPENSSQLKMSNIPIVWLIQGGYDVRRYQISGMPSWVSDNSVIYNIEAKGDSSVDAQLAKLTKDQLKQEHAHMYQALLGDRFNFKAHWETREGAVLNMVATKGRTKLVESTGAPPSAEDLKRWGDHPIPPVYQRGNGQLGYEFVGHGCSLHDLALMLETFMNSTIVDKTGMTGKYDFVLAYSYASDRERERKPEMWPPLRNALEDKLGLKFEDGKGPVKVLVVDHIDKPSPN